MRCLLLSLMLAPVLACGTTVTTTTWTYDGTAEADADTDTDTDADTDSDTDVDDTGTDDTGDPPGPQGQVVFLHLSPDADRLDVRALGQEEALASNLKFPDDSGALSMEVGSYEVVWVEAGGAEEDALSSTSLDVEEEVPATVVAYDSLASISTRTLQDDGSAIRSSEVRFRFAHLAADQGNLNIINIDDDEMIVEGMARGDTFTDDLYLDVDSIGIDWNGDTTPELRFALPLPEGGERMDVLIANNEGGTPIFLYVVEYDGVGTRIDAE